MNPFRKSVTVVGDVRVVRPATKVDGTSFVQRGVWRLYSNGRVQYAVVSIVDPDGQVPVPDERGFFDGVLGRVLPRGSTTEDLVRLIEDQRWGPAVGWQIDR